MFDNKNKSPQTDQPVAEETHTDQNQQGGTSKVHTMPGQFNKPPQKSSSGSKKTILITAAVVLVLAILIVGAVMLLSNGTASNDTTTNQETQTQDQQDANSNGQVNDNGQEEQEDDQTAQQNDSPERRDRQRINDITSLRTALNVYYKDHGAYPDILEDLRGEYLEQIPVNPSPGGAVYVYLPQSNNQSYEITFALESGAQLGPLSLSSGEYTATPEMIEPVIENPVEGNEQNDNQNDTSQQEIIPGLDSDSDGLSDIEENLYKTDATLVDTDEDGYTDATELINLYDPTSAEAIRLSETDYMEQYMNTSYRYTVLYPFNWTVRALDENKKEVLFNSATTEYIQILVRPNPVGLSAREWYLQQNPNAESDTLSEVSYNQISGVQTNDKRKTYLSVGSNIYSIIYNLGTSNQLNYQVTYELMLNSFDLTSISEDGPAAQRDQQRQQDVQQIYTALSEYQQDNLSLPNPIDSDVDSFQVIGSSSADCTLECGQITTQTDCIDLSSYLVPTYVEAIPIDPAVGSAENTGYFVNLLTNGQIQVSACFPEKEENINTYDGE